jgi:hypothetical protein
MEANADGAFAATRLNATARRARAQPSNRVPANTVQKAVGDVDSDRFGCECSPRTAS